MSRHQPPISTDNLPLGSTGAPAPAGVWERLRSNTIVRQVLVLAGGSLFSRVLLFAFTPVLGRLYTPEQYGVFSTFTSYSTGLMLVCCLNYEPAIPLAKDDKSAYNLMAACLYLLVLTCLLCPVLTWIIPMVRPVASLEMIRPYLWLLPIALFVGGIFQILTWWAIRTQAFGAIAGRYLTQALTLIAGQVFLRGYGPLGLIAGDTLGRTSGCYSLALDALRRGRRENWGVGWSQMRELLLRYRRFATVGIGSNVISRGAIIFGNLGFAQYWTVAETGALGFVNSVVGAALAAIGVSVSQVFLAKAAVMAREKPAELMQFYWRTFLTTLAVGLVPVLILLLGGQILFPLVFGAKWTEAGYYSQLLAIPFLLRFVVGSVLPILTVLERQGIEFFSNFVGFVILVGGIWWAGEQHMGARYGIVAIGTSLVVSYLLLFLAGWWAIHQHVASAPSPSPESDLDAVPTGVSQG